MSNKINPSIQVSIKVFLDGADRASMLEMAKSPLVHGFTTNPSLMKKSGVKDYQAFAKEMLASIADKPISFEVFADEPAEMKRQAGLIKTWGSNVYVKIPVMNSKGESCIPLIQDLSHQGVHLNVTAVYTLDQVYGIAQALKGGAPSVLSVFAGRIADSGRDPMPTMRAAAEICEAADSKIELLWASTREAFNLVQAAECGAKIITSPLEFIKKAAAFGKDLHQISLETVQTFKADSEAAGFRL